MRALTRLAAPAAVALSLLAAGCGGLDQSGSRESDGQEAAGEGPLLVYSGRSEQLVGPLLDRLRQALGTDVEVRYGESSELAAQLLEEGEATEADLFFSQDAGALGALAKAGRLSRLDDAVLSGVDERFVDDEGRWVATSARARVVAYHPEHVPEIGQIDEVQDLVDPTYRGRIGYAPTNASFHAFVTALRVAKGEDAARAWLQAFKANEPKAYEGNAVVLDAVDRGEVSLGLINHYYWYEKVAELGREQVGAQIHFLNSDDPGALVNVAGVGVLEGSDQAAAATDAVEFLLSDDAQRYFADETAEFPVVSTVATSRHHLPALHELDAAAIDLNDLDSLDQTLAMLEEVGLT